MESEKTAEARRQLEIYRAKGAASEARSAYCFREADRIVVAAERSSASGSAALTAVGHIQAAWDSSGAWLPPELAHPLEVVPTDEVLPPPSRRDVTGGMKK